MHKTSKILASLILAGLMPASAPATAQDIVVKAYPTFRDLEYDYSGSARVEAAKAALGARIPAGTEISLARAIMRKEGAHCGAAVGDGQTRCTFGGFEGIDDHLHNVVWTVRLNSRDGRIADLDVTRESLGS